MRSSLGVRTVGIDNIPSGRTRIEMFRIYIMIQLYQGKCPVEAIRKLNDLEREYNASLSQKDSD